MDVLLLFPRPDPRVVADLQHEDCRRIFLMGYREDADAILAASGRGIPVYVVEDLAAETLRRMAGGDGKVQDLYAGLGDLWAVRLGQFLARWQAEQALQRRETEVLDNHAYGKLGMSSRYEAIAVLMDRPRDDSRPLLPTG